ncbi:MAG: NAD(P)H-binding protein [Halioglobus sp.]
MTRTIREHLSRLLAVLACLALLSACAGPQPRLGSDAIIASSRPATQDTTIALLGGTGMAGSHILQQALARGYSLRILSRSPQKLAYLGDRVTVVSGDARNQNAIDELLTGSDVVISAIGPGNNSQSPMDLTITVTRNVLTAMQHHQIDRYILVSGAGVVIPGDQRNATGWLMRQLVKLRYRSLLADRQAEYEMLAKSQSNWTLVRCPLIDSTGFQREPVASLLSPGSFNLRAGELADFVLGQIDSDHYSRQGPFLYSQ